jgi:hypothetical protein
LTGIVLCEVAADRSVDGCSRCRSTLPDDPPSRTWTSTPTGCARGNRSDTAEALSRTGTMRRASTADPSRSHSPAAIPGASEECSASPSPARLGTTADSRAHNQSLGPCPTDTTCAALCQA